MGRVRREQFAAQRQLWRRNLPVGGRGQELAESGAEEIGAHWAGGGRSAGFEGCLRGGGGAALGTGRGSWALQEHGRRKELEGSADHQREHRCSRCAVGPRESGYRVCGGISAAATRV